LLEEKKTEGQALDLLGLRRYCCRRMILTHVELIDKLILYQPHNLPWLPSNYLDFPVFLIYQTQTRKNESKSSNLQYLLPLPKFLMIHYLLPHQPLPSFANLTVVNQSLKSRMRIWRNLLGAFTRPLLDNQRIKGSSDN